MLIAADKPFLDPASHWIAAVVIMLVTLVLAKLVNSLLLRSARRLDSSDGRSEPLSQSTITRLRLLRRLAVVFVILLGSFIALSQFEEFKTLSTALLASSAVLGVALGWASRAVLANAVAGMMLAAVQPFRIGDVIEWQEKRGRVEDITLTYTFLRLPSGHRLVIPNELIATTPVENYTIAGTVVDADATVRVRPAHAAAALQLLREKLDGASVQFGACEANSYEIRIGFSTSAGHEATERFATREQVVAILSDAGILD